MSEATGVGGQSRDNPQTLALTKGWGGMGWMGAKWLVGRDFMELKG